MMKSANLQKVSLLAAPKIKIDCEQSPGLTGDMREVFGYVEKTLYLCEGAKIVINRNINVQKGIYNAARGTIHKILFKDEKPVFLIIDLEKSKLKPHECYQGI